MLDESAPPPPPPTSPPPVLETTIGRYIARFRYEKPQPREIRVAAQRSDFWWTKSPRYSPSPSPPSTWSSGGVFRFPEDEFEEENEELEAKEDESEEENEEEDAESVDSVESKLRRRLGVWSSELSLESEKSEIDKSLVKSVEVLKSWNSVEWDLEEGEEEEVEKEEEDPEEVIARVRNRLGWGVTTSSVLSSSSSGRWKPLELKLKEKTNRGHRMEMKPPLSPGSYRRGGQLESFGFKSGLSWSSVGREDVSLFMRESREPIQEKVIEEQKSVMTSEEEMELVGESDNEQMEVPSLTDSDTKLDPSSSLVSCNGVDESTAFKDVSEDKTTDENESYKMVTENKENKEKDLKLSDCKTEGEMDEESQLNIEMQVQSAADVIEVNLLSTTSPARLEPVLGIAGAPSDSFVSNSYTSNSSSPGRSERMPTETANTLDGLVSLVVHSWENDFFSVSAIDHESPCGVSSCEENATNECNAGGVLSGASPLVSASLSFPSPTKDTTDEFKETSAEFKVQDPAIAELQTETTLSVVVHADTPNISSEDTTQFAKDEEEEETEDCVVPGEANDQIIQMLLKRITLLEAALSEIDN